MEIPKLPNVIYYAIPVFILTVIIEAYIIHKQNKKNYHIKDGYTSILMGLGNVFVSLLTNGFTLFIFYYIYENFRIFTLGFDWYIWLIIFFADDLSYYWAHRIGHVSRMFWASHIVHHSSEKYNLTTALRQTWTGALTSFPFYIWLPILGFHPVMIFMQQSINLLYQYWIHTELIDKMPKWFEAIFNTPSHHRVHHASNPQYLDRNFAGTLIIWDKLFKTFEPEVEKPVYGLTTNINTYNPVKIAFHEWIAMFSDVIKSRTSFIKKMAYLIQPPGWRHDGSGKLSTDMREEWEMTKHKKSL